MVMVACVAEGLLLLAVTVNSCGPYTGVVPLCFVLITPVWTLNWRNPGRAGEIACVMAMPPVGKRQQRGKV